MVYFKIQFSMGINYYEGVDKMSSAMPKDRDILPAVGLDINPVMPKDPESGL